VGAANDYLQNGSRPGDSDLEDAKSWSREAVGQLLHNEALHYRLFADGADQSWINDTPSRPNRYVVLDENQRPRTIFDYRIYLTQLMYAVVSRVFVLKAATPGLTRADSDDIGQYADDLGKLADDIEAGLHCSFGSDYQTGLEYSFTCTHDLWIEGSAGWPRLFFKIVQFHEHDDFVQRTQVESKWIRDYTSDQIGLTALRDLIAKLRLIQNGPPPPACASDVRGATDLNASTTTFSWKPPAGIDHVTVTRHGVYAASGTLSFPGVGPTIAPGTTSATMPFDNDYGASYSVCTFDRGDNFKGVQTCCTPGLKPTRTLCADVANCLVHGKQVLPSDGDDPVDWCKNAGGVIVKSHQCTTTAG
jgi:hypothetical protein